MNTMEQMPNEENMNQQQRRARPPPPEPPTLYCPRCRSFNIKFCYYNNYSLSQPRYFCKDCKRYWTHGGTLRDIPIGGGGRRGKRGRTLAAPSSLASDMARTTPTFSIASLPPQNQPGVISNQFPRAFPPVMPPVINSFTENGARFSSLMMQSPAGINQGTTVGLGVQGGHLGPNMALLQRLTPPYLVPQVPQPSQLQSNFYSSQQSMVLPRLGTSWTQSLMNSTVANSFGAGPSFRSSDQASSSYNPNHQWSADRLPGFGPPQP